MPSKIVEVPRIGPVLLVKRRGTKNLRITILPSGKVRVGLPIWAPYEVAVRFASSRADWILKNLKDSQPALLQNGHRIGKSYRLNFLKQPAAGRTYARLGINTITITSPLNFSDLAVQNHASKACERALRKEAEQLLPARLKQIAQKNSLAYSDIRIKKLSSRWGSCSRDHSITLNYFLVQLPWSLIDYVIIHELAHTEELNHSADFWRLVDSMLPNSKLLRKELRKYRPVLLPI
jgi:predicted metal-dependent hydrolase